MSDLLQKKLQRAQRRIDVLERMVDDQSRDLHEANRSLRDANGFMSEVLSSMAGTLVVTDAKLNVRLVNQDFYALLGYARNEVIGRPVEEVLPEADDFLFGESSQLFEAESYCLCKDGEHIPVMLTTGVIQPEEEGEQSWRGHIFMAIDIRERKAAEARLRDAQQQLMQVSRQAGMADIATGILHNVGNVLNSVNVSASLIRDRLQRDRGGDLRRLADLLLGQRDCLAEFFAKDPRAASVPDFLDQLAAHLAGERAAQLDELTALIRNLEHIKTIVASQQSFAKQGGAIETLQLREVVEAAMQVCEHSLDQAGVRIERDYADSQSLLADRHKIMQVVINLLSNARHALLDAGGDERHLRIHTTTVDGRARISVSDSGIGINAEHLERIFKLGFTTKPDGHGFGLHSSANAAGELGGRLVCHSDGPGRGATFTLELPIGGQEHAA